VAELLESFEDVQTDLSQAVNDPRLRETSDDLEKFTLAKTYFDLKEYYRAAHALDGCTSHRSVFLRSYSRFLVRFSPGWSLPLHLETRHYDF
jgi:anaphase-promoting complex subunit 8